MVSVEAGPGPGPTVPQLLAPDGSTAPWEPRIVGDIDVRAWERHDIGFVDGEPWVVYAAWIQGELKFDDPAAEDDEIYEWIVMAYAAPLDGAGPPVETGQIGGWEWGISRMEPVQP